MVAAAEPRAQVEVNAVDGRSALTRFANSFIHQNVGEQGCSVFLRVVVDGRVAGSSTTATDDASLDRLVAATLAAARLRPEDPDWPGLADAAPVPDLTATHYDASTEEADPADRAAVVRAFVDAGPGLRAAGYCDTEGAIHAFANTAGQRAEARSSRATLDAIHQVGETFDAAGKAHQTSRRLTDLNGAAGGRVAAQKARDSAEASDLEPGHYEVVLEPECVGEILSFLAFYGFNAKQVIEGQSFARVGEGQFDPAIVLLDSATDERAIGRPFDVEGTPKAATVLVDAGTTTGLVHDRRTAHRMGDGAVSTGHAIPGGETYGAFPENLFLAEGETAPADMVASVERGLLVTEFNYCRILDPKTQVVTGLTRNGTFLIENGKVTGAVKNLRFTQSFVDALAPGAVKAVGKDGRFAAAEFGVGMVHCPTLHLASWNFTGGARG
ncbi:MAG: TldD/PmbA family protein [Actinobacteria bacterium]|nr:TldD/PmbA family protein [Actinomycetota bacterium]